MITIDDMQYCGINYDGGFEFSFTSDGRPRIVKIWNNDGQRVRVPRAIFLQMVRYCQNYIISCQEMIDQRTQEAAKDL